MLRNIVLVQAHPDPAGGHFCHALADAYAAGARESGFALERIELSRIEFPLLKSKQEWESGPVPPAIVAAQQAVRQAHHLVFIYPLWLGGMPALLKGFLEQLARPGFAVPVPGKDKPWSKLLKGRSARVVVTMGMPAWVYRWYFGAHSLKSLERNILGFVGISPVRESLVGTVEGDPKRRQHWLERMRAAGRDGD